MYHDSEEQLYALLRKNELNYHIHHHDPVFTVDEGKHLSLTIAGAHSKNLFLKDKKGDFFLVSVTEDKRVDLKQLSKELGKGGLSFGTSDNLEENLHLTPGSVTPFGLIHEDAKNVKFVLDHDFMKYDYVNFHPLRNDKTIQMPRNDFLRFFEIIRHLPDIRMIPVITAI